MMLSTSRTKTNNKNNAYFKLLILSFLGGRVIACVSKICKEDQQRTDSNRCPEKGSRCLTQSGKLRQSAREFNVSKTTLKRFVDQMSIDEDTAKKSGYKLVGDRHRIFLQKWKKTSQTKSNHLVTCFTDSQQTNVAD